MTLAQALPTAKTIEQVKYGDGVSDVRASVVSYALQFVGNRYVWGGTSLEKGVDCSGFTMRILGKYGISLPHSSRAQPSNSLQQMLTMLYCISMVLPMFGSWTLRPIAEHHTVIRAHYNIRRINNDRKGKETGYYRRVR